MIKNLKRFLQKKLRNQGGSNVSKSTSDANLQSNVLFAFWASNKFRKTGDRMRVPKTHKNVGPFF